LLDDGNLELVVVSTRSDEVETRVIIGGVLKPHTGVNLPGAPIELPCTTEKDLHDLAFGLKLGIDAVALSFVRSAGDIIRLKNTIGQLAPEPIHLPIIAKLERPEALNNLVEIMEVTDGVMVARGDLGVEMPPEEVPIAQKRIIECANRHGKVVITATQMLESMINNPRPTRAEASDVANAILDGSDAVMLSGETAAGKYPVKAVQMMNAIIEQTEQHAARWGKCDVKDASEASDDDTYYMTLAAKELAQDRNVAAIAAFTTSGRTSLLMSKTRPSVPIMAFTAQQQTYNLMSLYWGVKPFLVPHANTVKAMVLAVEEALMKTTDIEPGQQFILICGFPVDKVRPTNLALLHTMGEPL
jgi:pyruvate kinase